ncbi:MAG: hypothetical protein C0602_08395 [Denitrovibrio sp.]|nr:MAG: hypothetical protein C0602_08395 [Denitrovibrio sp.]
MDKVQLIEAIRDFFYYGRSEEMRESYSKIHNITGVGTPPEKINWEEAEFLFNKLFVGPAKPIAPPIASVYLDPEEIVQGRVTASVREFYNTIGLSLEEAGSRPEDSIEYELDACRYLLLLGEQVPEALDAYEGFINEHMNMWVGEFAEKGMNHCEDGSPVKDVLRLLASFIEQESKMTVKSKEMS